MNAAGVIAERAYERLKAQLLQGLFRPGARLDPAHLADRLDSSVTPVRAGLNMLVGEGLIETGTGEGYHVPLLDEPALRDRYLWSAELLGLLLRRPREDGLEVQQAETTDQAARTAALFAAVARGTGNPEHVRAIQAVNDRLHAVRVAETLVLPGVEPELDEIARALTAGVRAPLRGLIARYHRRRIRASATVLRQLYRMPDASAQ